MKEAITNFNWNKAFENLTVDEKVYFLIKTLLNTFRNYIQNKKIKCDYRQPPCMEVFKRKIKDGKTFLKKWSEKN